MFVGKDARVGRYRLRDNYIRFYLRYIAPQRTEIKSGAFKFSSVSMLPGWNAMLGLQFENLVVNNVRSLIPLLGIGSNIVLSAAPYRNVRKDSNTREEKLLSCKIACEAGVDFVKTSTGFGTGGATLEDVQLMRAAIGPEMGLKAAGGIRTCADALAMLRAGATRLGTSAGRAIVEGLEIDASSD